jgi:hypothetical protein
MGETKTTLERLRGMLVDYGFEVTELREVERTKFDLLRWDGKAIIDGVSVRIMSWNSAEACVRRGLLVLRAIKTPGFTIQFGSALTNMRQTRKDRRSLRQKLLQILRDLPGWGDS